MRYQLTIYNALNEDEYIPFETWEEGKKIYRNLLKEAKKEYIPFDVWDNTEECFLDCYMD